jgi:hypothetical protein
MQDSVSPTPTSLVSALAVALAVACGGTQPTEDDKPVAPPTPQQVVSSAKNVLDRYQQGYVVLSPEALQPIYIEGLDVVVTVQGKSYRGWSQVEAYLRDLFARAETIRIDFANVSVVALGNDAAEVTADLTREIKEGATMVKETGVLSLTLSRIDREWLIRTEHFSYGLR